jgi:hypothetical protein
MTSLLCQVIEVSSGLLGSKAILSYLTRVSLAGWAWALLVNNSQGNGPLELFHYIVYVPVKSHTVLLENPGFETHVVFLLKIYGQEHRCTGITHVHNATVNI